MDYETGLLTLMNGVRGFHGRFKKMFGQMALRLDDETYLFTGDNKLLAGILEEDIVECDINTGYLGSIFRRMPNVNALIFGCTQDSVAVSEMGHDMRVALDDLANISGATVPLIDDANPADVSRVLSDSSVCLVKGSGLLAATSNMRKAVAAMQIVQKSCEAVVHGEMLGGIKPFSESVANGLEESFKKRYVEINEADNVDFVGYDEETFALRNEIIEHGKDLVRHDLVYGAWGNLSVRVDDDNMLITPSSIDYFDIRIEDIVEMDINTLEYGEQRVPSSDSALHAEMYKSLPGCNAIIHTHSNAMGVFAACEAGFAINDPVMQQLIGDIKVVPYNPIGSEQLTSDVISAMKDTHAVILAHHGALFYGPSLEVVFQIAESVEMMARNLLGFDKKEDEAEA